MKKNFYKMNIYISNLSYRVVESDLKQLFEQCGEVVSTKVIIDGQTGRSKCFGFVTMAEKEAMQNAISKLHRTMYDGKVINVTESRVRDDKPPAKSGHGGGVDRRLSGDGGYGDKQKKD